MSAPGTEVVFGSSLSTSNVIQKRSNASSLMSQIHRVCGLARMVTIYQGKDGAYVAFEKTGGMWNVMLRSGAGEVADKVCCDDYRQAVEYRKSFIRIARNGARP